MPADEPLVVFDRVKSADVLVAVDRAALGLGLRPGLALADARARLPDLYAAPAMPTADAALLDRIAADCDRYTPLVGRDPPDGVTLNITGAAHLFGGEAGLAAAVGQRLASAGLAARVVIAGAPDTARALARYAHAPRDIRLENGCGARCGAPGLVAPPPLIIAPDGDATAVLPLPIAALRLPPDTVTGLVRAGLKTIGHLAHRPRAPLAARFGPELLDRLERTLGRVLSPISPWRPEPIAHADLICGEPIVRGEDVDRALAHLAAELAGELDSRELGARRLEATFFRVDGHVRRVEVAMARASRDVTAMTRLLGERLAALAAPLDPGFGFDLVRLSALHAEPLPPAQGALGDGKPADAGLPELIDRLSARFGSGNIAVFRPRDSHIPERASTFAPATAAAGLTSLVCVPTTWPTPEPGEPPLRPPSLFDPPQPIEAMAPVPDGPPLRFRWRRVVHDVALAEGPERIAPEWWRLPPSSCGPPRDESDTPALVRGKKLPREDIPPRKGSMPGSVPVVAAAAEAPAHVSEVSDGSPRPMRDWLGETRDYYRVEDRNGRRYWLFRAGLWQPGGAPPRWFMHGLFP